MSARIFTSAGAALVAALLAAGPHACAAPVSGAGAGDGPAAAIEQTRRDIQSAVAELGAARDATARARAPLNTQMETLETAVRDLRAETARLRAQVQQSETDRRARETAAHVLESEGHFAITIMQGYRSGLEARSAALPLPADLRHVLDELTPKLASPGPDVLPSLAGRVLEAAAQWNRLQAGGAVYPGTCLDDRGAERSGRFVLAGPLAWFVDDAGTLAGRALRSANATEPAVRTPLDAAGATAVASVADGREADLPVQIVDAGTLARRGGMAGALIAVLRGRGTAEDLALFDMIRQAWPVLLALFLASIWACAIIIERTLVLRRAHLDASQFVEAVLRDLQEGGVPRALEHCDRYRKPVAAVVAAVLRQSGTREDMERSMRHAIQAQLHVLEHRVPILGTIGSTAPFVGLLGTVAGIIRAFRDIAANAGGGPSVVSAGIAEALATTAFGLLVAIPAVMFYNHFINSLRRFTSELEMNVYHVIDALCGPPSAPSGDETRG